uniref:NTR domain-containing protein n=1 Tax=Elaeophora elaphi TaxID=1147741 RepID=A0A0R3RIE8_9BILA
MIISLLFCISVLSFSIVRTTTGCNIIIRVKSLADKPFQAQIIAPNGKVSEKKLLKKSERLIFQEKADECGLGLFQIKTFSEDTANKKEETVKVTLNGIGAVNYEVRNDLIPKQIFRQGAECQGQCAPLGVTQKHTTKANATKV